MTRTFESIGPGYVISAEKPDHHNNDGLRLAVAGNLPREQVEWLVDTLSKWLGRAPYAPPAPAPEVTCPHCLVVKALSEAVADCREHNSEYGHITKPEKLERWESLVKAVLK
jgi:hypothetical protein